MQAERLHRVAFDIQQELHYRKVEERFDRVLQYFQNLVNLRSLRKDAPADSDEVPAERKIQNVEASFSESLWDLYDQLTAAQSNELVPSQVQILKAIGGWELTGQRLQTRISDTLSSNVIGQKDTLVSLQSLKSQLSMFTKNLNQLVTGMEGLSVAKATLVPNEAELGVLFPVETDQVRLTEVRDELQHLDRYIPVFTELVGESGTSARVRAVSSSGIEVYLAMALPAAFLVSKVIRTVTQITNDVLQIRQNWEGLKDLNFKSDLEEQEVKGYVDQRIEELREELLESHDEEETGRTEGEFDTLLNRALYYIFDSVDEGTVFEINILTTSSEKNEGEGLDILGFTTFHQMKIDGSAMRNIKRNGDRILFSKPPELLRAPESEEESAEDVNDDESPADSQGETDDDLIADDGDSSLNSENSFDEE